jgi:hypothetical protein
MGGEKNCFDFERMANDYNLFQNKYNTSIIFWVCLSSEEW